MNLHLKETWSAFVTINEIIKKNDFCREKHPQESHSFKGFSLQK